MIFIIIFVLLATAVLAATIAYTLVAKENHRWQEHLKKYPNHKNWHGE